MITQNKSNSKNKQLSKMSRNSNQTNGKKTITKRIRAKFFIFDISKLIQISRELAERYIIQIGNLEKSCEQNMCAAALLKRFDIVKVSIESNLNRILIETNRNFSLIKFTLDMGYNEIHYFGRSKRAEISTKPGLWETLVLFDFRPTFG